MMTASSFPPQNHAHKKKRLANVVIDQARPGSAGHESQQSYTIPCKLTSGEAELSLAGRIRTGRQAILNSSLVYHYSLPSLRKTGSLPIRLSSRLLPSVR